MQDYSTIKVGVRSSMKVSNEDLEALNKIHWSLGTHGYAYCNKTGKRLHPHRLVAEAMLGRRLLANEDVDHKNHDVLDNRRENLRACVPWQNQANKTIASRNSTGYKGVSRVASSGHWRAYVGGRVSTGKQIKIGTFHTPEEAAWAYDMWASQIFGEFSVLNFKYV